METSIEKPVSEYSGLFHPYLSEDEVVLWSGKPPRGVRFEPGDIFLVPFSLILLGSVLLWTVLLWVNGEGSLLLCAIPFLVVLAYVSIGRFIPTYYHRERTFYSVTNKNAYILRRERREHCQAILLQTINSIRLETWQDGQDGRGNITFDLPVQVRQTYPLNWSLTTYAGLTPPPMFEKIRDAKQVYQLIRRAQEEGTERPVLSDEKQKYKGYFEQ